MRLVLVLFWGLALLMMSGTALAAPKSNARSYAIVVGTNQGGEGQKTLKYAERDASRMATLLVSLGRVPKGNVTLLLGAEARHLEGSILTLAEKLKEHRDRGEKSQVFFYYSGHARARALNLGAREFRISKLRRRLLTLKATLKIVILDACQSGAFSRVKGVNSAEDFSFNSVSQLDTRGLAVMASSSSSELSQESDVLQGSHFTHHLLVGLRGAADKNRDGRVSLEEAYRYAYQRTLASTSRTAIGSQHVTLERKLRGKGQVALTFPAKAKSKLELPKGLGGTILVQKRKSGSVMAEITKVSSDTVRLALPRGKYSVVVRQGKYVFECEVRLRRSRAHVLSLDQCKKSRFVPGSQKGSAQPKPQPAWGVEIGAGFGLTHPNSEFTERLEQFRFEPNRGFLSDDPVQYRYSLTVSRGLQPNLGVGLQLRNLDYRQFTRDDNSAGSASSDGNYEQFFWYGHGLGLFVRGLVPIHLSARSRRINLYLQAGAGPALGHSQFEERGSEPLDTSETFWGYHLTAATGIQIMMKHAGAFLDLGYSYAPVVSNLLGETHNSGGLSVVTGFRFTTFE